VFGARNEVTTDDVGDGVDWLDGSAVTVEELTLGGNARPSLRLDGPVSGHLGAIDFAGDADKPLVQQNFTSGARPTGTTLPTRAERTLAIPQPL
jgi:hypothetical protein